MRSILIALSAAALFALAGCSGNATEDSGDNSAAVSSPDDLAWVRLDNGGNEVVQGSYGQYYRRVNVIAGAKGVTAQIAKEGGAACVATVVTPEHANPEKTYIDIEVEWDVDDGWNGCVVEFTGPEYKSSLEVSYVIND